MIRSVKIKKGATLAEYGAFALLSPLVSDFTTEVSLGLNHLQGRKIWLVSSTDKGGGVAEMLPTIIRLVSEFEVKIEWIIIGTEETDFFPLTKKLHNLIHGKGETTTITEEERRLYEKVNEENALALQEKINPGDIVIIHDPQPMAMAGMIKQHKDIIAIWRCHIGLDKKTPQTKAAWDFLQPYIKAYDHNIFSAPEYIPEYIMGNVSIIHPGIDPLSHKNRELSLTKVTGILDNACLIPDHHPSVFDPFPDKVKRIQLDGSLDTASKPEDIGLLFRPTITQISRWDRLKGFVPLMKGFTELKRNMAKYDGSDSLHKRRLQAMRLVLAGPDPAYVFDDPEGLEVLKELTDFYVSLPTDIAKDIALLMLPMSSAKNNALIVNALQRSSSIVVQNSLEEGFGLTVTEGMWKRIPVMGSHACGIRHQVRDDLDGKLVNDPEDPIELADTLNYMLKNPKKRDIWSHSGQKRVIDNFLVFNQLRNWMNTMVELTS